MTEYLAVPLDHERHQPVDLASRLICVDDPDAIESARHLLQGDIVEVWDDGRLVGVIPADSTA